MRIGFIGLGRMGRPMSESLARAGHELTLLDAQPEVAAERATRYGGGTAATPSEIAERCEAAVLSVPGPAESTAVVLGSDGLLASARSGFLIIDMTTNTVSLSRDLAARAAECGVDYLDAPVSRGGRGALTVMVGGEAAAFERARPLLEAIAETVCRVGSSGLGTSMKLVNQAVYVTYMAAFAEGLALAEASGAPLDAALACLGTAAAGDPLITTKYEEIRGLSNKRFAVSSALRYLDYAALAFGGRSPIIDAAATSLRAVADAGAADEDLIVARHRYPPKRP